MACFLAPMTEAIVITVVQKVVEKRAEDGTVGARGHQLYLWGGSVLLAFEHLWHGEIVPWPPFLTAMKNPADVGPMLHEIATVGTAMAVTVTAVWALMVLIVSLRVRAVGGTGTTPYSGRSRIMWLILTAFAAIITTVVWYVSPQRDTYRLGLLSLAFWGSDDHVAGRPHHGLPLRRRRVLRAESGRDHAGGLGDPRGPCDLVVHPAFQ